MDDDSSDCLLGRSGEETVYFIGCSADSGASGLYCSADFQLSDEVYHAGDFQRAVLRTNGVTELKRGYVGKEGTRTDEKTVLIMDIDCCSACTDSLRFCTESGAEGITDRICKGSGDNRGIRQSILNGRFGTCSPGFLRCTVKSRAVYLCPFMMGTGQWEIIDRSLQTAVLHGPFHNSVYRSAERRGRFQSPFPADLR